MAVRIFHHYWHLPLALLALIETLVAALSLYAAHLLVDPAATALSVWPLILFCGVLFIANAAVGLYSSRQRSRFMGHLTRLVIALVAGLIFVALLAELWPPLGVRVTTVLLAGAFAAVGFALARLVFESLVNEDVFKRRVLVFGAGYRATSISKLRRRSDRRGFHVVGFVPADGDHEATAVLDSRLPADKSLLEQCRSNEVDEIVVAMDDRRRRFPMDQLLECRLDGIEITELVTFLERETGKVRLDVLNPSWMIFSTGFRRGQINAVSERIFDATVSLIFLVAAFPFMLLAMLAIKLEDGFDSSVFYSQLRVGQHGREFKLLKFRSMRADAERDGKAQWAVKNDSRVTRVGAFIRKTRIDELPQILNVLRGEMSFVGPRPERPQFVKELSDKIPYYRERHAIKPGITGWAQLCYPYGSSEQDAIEKLQYDLYYVKNHSLLFYWAILVQTVEVIVWRKGAR